MYDPLLNTPYLFLEFLKSSQWILDLEKQLPVLEPSNQITVSVFPPAYLAQGSLLPKNQMFFLNFHVKMAVLSKIKHHFKKYVKHFLN